MSKAEQVKKLLRLSTSGNPHEAEAASIRAREIMERYGLSEDDITDDVTVFAFETGTVYHYEVARIVAERYRLSAMVSNLGRVAFRGKEHIANRACSIYDALTKSASVNSEVSPYGNPPPSAKEVWKACYWYGFIEAIGERMGVPIAPPKRDSAPTQPASQTYSITLEAFDIFDSQIANELGESEEAIYAIEHFKDSARQAGRLQGEAMCINIGVESPMLGGIR